MGIGPNVHLLTEVTSLESTDELYIVRGGASDRKVKFSNFNPTEKEVTVTSDYTVVNDNAVVFASGTLTVTLPAASNAWKASVANIGTGTVTIQCAGSDQIIVRGIGNSSSYILADQGATVTLRANGGLVWCEF
jgi:hypothetical protein